MQISIAFLFLLFLQQYVSANHILTAELYSKISETSKGNFLIAVFPLEVSLTLLLGGANGTTFQQLQTLLDRANTSHAPQEIIATLLHSFLTYKNFTFKLANGVFVKESLKLNLPFRKAAVNLSSAAVNINFTNSNSYQVINDWAYSTTDNNIRNTLDSSDIYSALTAISVQAFFFRVNWSHTFLSESLVPERWYQTKTDYIMVNTMYQHGHKGGYLEDKALNATILKLPLVDDSSDIRAVFVLPRQRDGLSELEKHLVEVFGPHQTQEQNVYVQLPKFHFAAKMELRNILKQLGVVAPFDKSQVNFSGIAGNKSDVILDNIVQKSVIQLNEFGINQNSGPPGKIPYPPPRVVSFFADHPFIFYVTKGDTIIFAGRVVSPNLASEKN